MNKYTEKLNITNPSLCIEWDYIKNVKTPENITAGSGLKAWWVCSKCNFSWQSVVYGRAGKDGKGCPNCKKSKLSNLHLQCQSDVIEKANLIHEYFYDYSLVEYKGIDNHITILCPIHGEFVQTPYKHINLSRGCQTCGISKQVSARTKTLDKFINESNAVYNNKYDYSESIYVNSTVPVKVKCNEHGYFLVRPTSHLYGKECPSCQNNNNYLESLFLDDFGIPKNCRNIQLNVIGKTIKPDGYLPDYNLIIEFDGDYYHGNPKYFNPSHINPSNNKTYGELYKNTVERRQFLITNGFKVISVWASEFARIKKSSTLINEDIKYNTKIDDNGVPVFEDKWFVNNLIESNLSLVRQIIRAREELDLPISDSSKWRNKYG